MRDTVAEGFTTGQPVSLSRVPSSTICPSVSDMNSSTTSVRTRRRSASGSTAASAPCASSAASSLAFTSADSVWCCSITALRFFSTPVAGSPPSAPTMVRLPPPRRLCILAARWMSAAKNWRRCAADADTSMPAYSTISSSFSSAFSSFSSSPESRASTFGPIFASAFVKSSHSSVIGCMSLSSTRLCSQLSRYCSAIEVAVHMAR
mmetsp:Transcript_10377/g.26608  ORF Transcript_10377/g.26608 Transcript_10377/m.26608 type:complete len:206 (-) Transcript_10377:898-1515(-)